MQYTKKVMDHFLHPKHSREMKDADAVGEVGNPRCGDLMKVYIKVGKNKKGEEIIKDISFNTFGCAAAISASDILCEMAKGKTIKEAEKINNKQINEYLGGLPQIKVHCSVLGEQALKKAIQNYKKIRTSRVSNSHRRAQK
ncbi:MAG: iron-sulfur cluster assembly scaffold protein [Candidatus Nanoarchaeia archaeon]